RVWEDSDAVPVGEDRPQFLLHPPPLRGHDEEQPLHGQRRGERRRSPRYPPPVTRGGVVRTSIAPAKPALETSTTGRERFSIGPLLVDGRAPVGPRTGALERRGGAQDA